MVPNLTQIESEVLVEVLEVRRQYRRIPIIPIARAGAALPVTMVNAFSPSELEKLVRYADIPDLTQNLLSEVIDSADAQATQIAEGIARSIENIRGQDVQPRG